MLLPLMPLAKAERLGQGFSQIEKLEIELDLMKTLLLHSEQKLSEVKPAKSYQGQHLAEFWEAAIEGYEIRIDKLQNLIDLLKINQEIGA